jgi:RNA polymerase sigma-70 factor (ECF subfamily)
MVDSTELERFEAVVLPHLDSAYTLARYLTRDLHDAEDVVQEAYLRALRYFGGYRGGDARAWMLAIVRNTFHTWRRRERREMTQEFDEEQHSDAIEGAHPGALLDAALDRESLERALDRLPTEFREVLVLRELEGMSYKEIGTVVGVPEGTVMSRLSRARERLRRALLARKDAERP